MKYQHIIIIIASFILSSCTSDTVSNQVETDIKYRSPDDLTPVFADYLPVAYEQLIQDPEKYKYQNVTFLADPLFSYHHSSATNPDEKDERDRHTKAEVAKIKLGERLLSPIPNHWLPRMCFSVSQDPENVRQMRDQPIIRVWGRLRYYKKESDYYGKPKGSTRVAISGECHSQYWFRADIVAPVGEYKKQESRW